MIAREDNQTERIVQQMQKEGRQNRRRLEKLGGIITLILSLIMTTVFLLALKYTQNAGSMRISVVFFLALAIYLFARGFRDAFLGRKLR